MNGIYNIGLITLTKKFGFDVGLSYNTPDSGKPIDDVYSVSFDGVDDYSHNPSIPYSTLGTEFSFAFWIKQPTSEANDRRFISCREGGSITYFEVVRHITTGNNLKIYFRGTTGSGAISTNPGTFTNNEWHHCMMTWNGSTVKIYADGVLDKTSNAFSGNLLGGALRCGAYAGGGVNGECKLDELAFWDKRLNASEVSEVYAAGVVQDLSELSTSSDLVNWWRMGDGDTYPILKDSVGTLDMEMFNMTASDIETDTP